MGFSLLFIFFFEISHIDVKYTLISLTPFKKVISHFEHFFILCSVLYDVLLACDYCFYMSMKSILL